MYSGYRKENRKEHKHVAMCPSITWGKGRKES